MPEIRERMVIVVPYLEPSRKLCSSYATGFRFPQQRHKRIKAGNS